MSTENQSNRKSKKKKTPVETKPSTPKEHKDENIFSSQDIFDGRPINYINSLSSNPKFNLDLEAYRKLLAGIGYLVMKKGLEPRLVKNSYKLAAASTKLRLNNALNPSLYTDIMESLRRSDFFKQHGYWPNQNVIRFDFTKPFIDFYSCGRLNEGSLLFQHSNNIANSIPLFTANASIYDSYRGLSGVLPPYLTHVHKEMKSPFFKIAENPFSIYAAREVNNSLELTSQIIREANQLLYGANDRTVYPNFAGNDWSKGIGLGLPSYINNPITGSILPTYNNLGEIPGINSSIWSINNRFENLSDYINKNDHQYGYGYNANTVYTINGVFDRSRGIGSGLPSYMNNPITGSILSTYNKLGEIPGINSSILNIKNRFGNLSDYINKKDHQYGYGYIANPVYTINGVFDRSKGIVGGVPSYLDSINEVTKPPYFHIDQSLGSNSYRFRSGDHLDNLNGFLGIQNSKLEWCSLPNQNLRANDLTWNSHKNGCIWESITQIPAKPIKEEEYPREKAIIKVISGMMKDFITEIKEVIIPQNLEQVLNKMDRIEALWLSNVSHTLMQANTEEDYIDRLEVMAILNISESTFYRECKKWNPHRVGNKSLFLRSEIFKQTRYYLK